MKRICTKCNRQMMRNGLVRRKRDRKKFQRFRCRKCGASCLETAGRWDHGLRNRSKIESVRSHLAEGVSERKTARLVGVSPSTVAAWKVRLAQRARNEMREFREKNSRRWQTAYLDEAITFETTRCKPLAVSVVASDESHLLAFSVAEMPAIGKNLAKISIEKYGKRRNRRRAGVRKTLYDASPCLSKDPVFLTDKEASYPALIKKRFGPKVKHKTYKAKRAAVAGQGEMKTRAYDPIFPANHLLARMRDGVSSMIRQTWSTAKRVWSLMNHLYIFAAYHNERVQRRLDRKEQARLKNESKGEELRTKKQKKSDYTAK